MDFKLDILNPSSLKMKDNASQLFKRDSDKRTGIVVGSKVASNDDDSLSTLIRDGGIKIPFSRQLGPVSVNDYLTLSISDLSMIGKALGIVNELKGERFLPSGDSGRSFMRSNNVVLKDWPSESILKNSKYRLTDAHGRDWHGPLRTLGILTHVYRPKLVGYVITRQPLLKLPDLKKQLTYPLGSASVRLNKTHQDLRSFHKMMPVYASYDVILDVSVSTMYEHEGKFLRNAISPHHFSYDVLATHVLANELRGDFLASAIEGHNDIYLSGTTEYCIKHAEFGVDDLDLAGEILSNIVGSYNYASMGLKYQFLSSKSMPDPIQVGNLGDVNGNMGGSDTEFDISKSVDKLAAGSLNFLKTMYASPTIGDVGLAKNDGKGATGPGWQKPPAPDAGMAWNLSHMQAAHHLDGQTLIPPTIDWFKEVRVVILNDTIAKKLASAGNKGSGKLRLSHDFGDDYVFVPAINYMPGYSHLIHQDGSVVNVLVDQYNPEVDDDS